MEPGDERLPSGKRPLRPLLPAGGGQHVRSSARPRPSLQAAATGASSYSSSSSAASQPISTTTRLARPRDHYIAAACDNCRLRKTKCDAQRPKCASCIRRSVPCVYATAATETHAQAFKRKHDELQARNKTLEELVQLLQSRSDSEARDIFQMIRAHNDVESVVRHVRDGSLLLQLALRPEARFRYQFPHVKDVCMPLYLQVPDNMYMDSLICAATECLPSRPTHALPRFLGNDAYEGREMTSLYQKPFHAARLVDPILASAKPSQWTNVSSDDDLMRDLLSTYFLGEHMAFTNLHKSLFLEDMLSRSMDHCSSLLVNAILAIACRCSLRVLNRVEYWNPNNLGYRFLAEAKRLWDLAEHESRVTTIQAAVLLSTISCLDGADTIGWRYAARAVEMARELRLFSEADPKLQLNLRMQVARKFTAWAVFCWQGMFAYVVARTPLMDGPPDFTLPDPTLSPAWYGDLWVRYPGDRASTPIVHGHTFKARVEFVVIENELAHAYFGASSPRDRRDVQGVLYFRSKFQAWFDALPEPLQSRNIVLPAELKLHMLYYSILINLFKGLIEEPLDDVDHAKFISQVQQTPQEAMASAMIRLEFLFRLYYLRHGFDAADAHMLHFYNVLGFTCLAELQAGLLDDNRRSLLLMCALGLREQGQYYYLMRTIYHLFRGSMSAHDVNLLTRYAQEKSAERDELFRPQGIISDYLLDLVDISQDPRAHRVSDFVERYDPDEQVIQDGKPQRGHG